MVTSFKNSLRILVYSTVHCVFPIVNIDADTKIIRKSELKNGKHSISATPV